MRQRQEKRGEKGGGCGPWGAGRREGEAERSGLQSMGGGEERREAERSEAEAGQERRGERVRAAKHGLSSEQTGPNHLGLWCDETDHRPRALESLRAAQLLR